MVKCSDQKLSPRLPLLWIPSVSSGQGLVSCPPPDMFRPHHLQSHSHPWCCSGMWSPPFLWDEDAIQDILPRASKVNPVDKEKRKEEGSHKIPKCLPVLPCMNPWGSFSLVFSKELTSLHFLLIYIKPLVSSMCFYFYCLGPFTIILFVKAYSNILMLRRSSWNSSKPISQAKQAGWKEGLVCQA